jgi:NAD(P)-dependent dehydrogenase (short-subunit alcohol dehydrogenase family)
MRLAGKACFVTGGASGLGEAMVRRLVAEGAEVVIADIDRDGGEARADDLGAAARFISLDVREEEEWMAAYASCERVDVLVNNASITSLGSTL